MKFLSAGAGYAYWCERLIALDRSNPHVAARLARSLDRLTKFDAPPQARMRDALDEARRAVRSADVIEILDRTLAAR